ncbi:MAG: hypothetical protein Q9M97_05815 [Candidatus Gracilibacteria bacterium]|nr:hypothetical protein [Candidatus Gracilibacteria bacterium]
MEGIEIELENIGISLTYPPNNFIDILKEGKQNIKPIFFIDSIEKIGENFISTKKEFIKSRKRSRSSLFLK